VTAAHPAAPPSEAPLYSWKLPELAGQASLSALPEATPALSTVGGGGGSVLPGEPPSWLEGRQFPAWPQALGAAVKSAATNEKPPPSVMGYQLES
jgi:hypothetical protein